MKKAILLFALISSAFTQASVSTSVTVTSDYVWRGQTQGGTAPAVQGMAEYSYKFLTVGTWLSSLSGSNGGAEVDFYLSLNHEFNKDFSISLGATNYTYTKSSNGNFLEYGITLNNPYANLFVASTSEYLALDTSSMYFQLSRSFELKSDDSGKLGLSLALGMTTFDKEVVAGSKDYMDYKIGLVKSKGDIEYELFFTDTDRKTWNGTTEGDTKESTLGVSLTHSL